MLEHGGVMLSSPPSPPTATNTFALLVLSQPMTHGS